MQSQSQNSPSQNDPLCSGSQNLIQAAELALAQISLILAGDGAHTGLLARLEQNDHDQSNAAQDYQSDIDILQNSNFLYLPPRVLHSQ